MSNRLDAIMGSGRITIYNAGLWTFEDTLTNMNLKVIE